MLEIVCQPPEQITVCEYRLAVRFNKPQKIDLPTTATIMSVAARGDRISVFAKVGVYDDFDYDDYLCSYEFVILKTDAVYKNPPEDNLAFLGTVWLELTNISGYHHVFYRKI